MADERSRRTDWEFGIIGALVIIFLMLFLCKYCLICPCAKCAEGFSYDDRSKLCCDPKTALCCPEGTFPCSDKCPFSINCPSGCCNDKCECSIPPQCKGPDCNYSWASCIAGFSDCNSSGTFDCITSNPGTVCFAGSCTTGAASIPFLGTCSEGWSDCDRNIATGSVEGGDGCECKTAEGWYTCCDTKCVGTFPPDGGCPTGRCDETRCLVNGKCCLPAEASCQDSTDCCSSFCNPLGKCGCKGYGKECEQDAQCCGSPSQVECKLLGNSQVCCNPNCINNPACQTECCNERCEPIKEEGGCTQPLNCTLSPCCEGACDASTEKCFCQNAGGECNVLLGNLDCCPSAGNMDCKPEGAGDVGKCCYTNCPLNPECQDACCDRNCNLVCKTEFQQCDSASDCCAGNGRTCKTIEAGAVQTKMCCYECNSGVISACCGRDGDSQDPNCPFRCGSVGCNASCVGGACPSGEECCSNDNQCSICDPVTSKCGSVGTRECDILNGDADCLGSVCSGGKCNGGGTGSGGGEGCTDSDQCRICTNRQCGGNGFPCISDSSCFSSVCSGGSCCPPESAWDAIESCCWNQEQDCCVNSAGKCIEGGEHIVTTIGCFSNVAGEGQQCDEINCCMEGLVCYRPNPSDLFGYCCKSGWNCYSG